MGLFSRHPSKADFQGHKRIKFRGQVFVIRRINPLLDFPSDRMPQLFTSFVSRRKAEEKPPILEQQERMVEDVKMIVAAGVVEPELVPVGKGDLRGREPGITVDDLFRDPEVGTRLYSEIMAHSLGRFKGLRGLFFYLRTKFFFFTHLRQNTDRDRLSYSSPTAVIR